MVAMPGDKGYHTLGIFKVNWFASGDKWMDRFAVALNQGASEVRFRGYKFDETTRPYVAISLGAAKNSEQYNVFIAPMKGAIALVVDSNVSWPVGFSDAIADAAKLATAWMSAEGHTYVWSAVIGALPEGVTSSVFALMRDVCIESFSLRSSEDLLVEAWNDSRNPSLRNYRLRSSVPILVRGKSRGYSWQEAGYSAARNLNMICALLSIAWDTCLVIRESPAPIKWGERKVPERIEWQDLRDDFVLPDIANVERKDVPSWMEAAWERMKPPNSQIARALRIYHEGLQVQYSHPSLALVAFVSAIETISQLVYRDRFCCCGFHKDIARKFRSTLKLVCDENVARELGSLYSWRSKVVHGGCLYGGEESPGSSFPFIWSTENTLEFTRMLFGMREASRKLMLLAVQGELPEISDLPLDSV